MGEVVLVNSWTKPARPGFYRNAAPAEIHDLSETFLREQIESMRRAPIPTRVAAGELLLKITRDLNLIRTAIRTGIEDGKLEEALDALEELRIWTFAGAEEAPQIVRIIFFRRRDDLIESLARELETAVRKLCAHAECVREEA